MASPAPAAQTPTNGQHANGNRGNQQGAGGQENQHFSHKQRNGNPPFKKGDRYREKSREDLAYNGNQQQDQHKERRPRREDSHESNGSPRSDEYRRGPRGRGNREYIPQSGSPNVNGNHAAPVKSEPNNHTDQTKAKNNDSVDEAVRILMSELQVRFPNIHPDKIMQVIKKHNYDQIKSLNELEKVANGEKQPWIEILKQGKAAKPETPAAPQAPAQVPAQTPAPAQNEHSHKRDKKREQHNQDQAQTGQQQPSQPQPNNQPRPHQKAPQPPSPSQPQASQPQQAQLPAQGQHYPTQQFYQQHPFQDQLHQQIVQQHSMQPYQQPFGHPEAFAKGDEDILGGLSKVIERELAEVQKKTTLLSLFKTELDTIHDADKVQRTQLETQRVQLEKDRQAYAEHLRRVETELASVEQRIKSAEEDKRTKVDDLYRKFKSNGILAITNS